MAFPVILIDSATGSDTAASGAGPSTALTGTAAATSGDGLTVTLDGSPSLAGVATDGSHAIYLANATAGARNFAKITGKDDTAKTVTVAEAFAFSLTGKTWAIGGKRASMGGGTSLRLVDNNSASGDAMPGWTLRMSSGHAETRSATLNVNRSGDLTSGPITIEGDSSASTVPILTFTNNGAGLSVRVGVIVSNIEFRNTNATKTASVAFQTTGANGTATFRKLKAAHSTDKFYAGYSSSQGSSVLVSCEIGYCAGPGFNTNNSAYSHSFYDCFIHDCGGAGIVHVDNVLVVVNSLIVNNGAAGIDVSGSGGGISTYGPPHPIINNSTISGNVGDGIVVRGSGSVVYPAFINNDISNNGGYGIKFNNTTNSEAASMAMSAVMQGNNFYNNTSGVSSPSLTNLNQSTTSLNPSYTNSGGGNWAVGNASLKGAGHPQQNIGVGSSTRSYPTPGAAQPNPASGGLLINPGLSGGLR